MKFKKVLADNSIDVAYARNTIEAMTTFSESRYIFPFLPIEKDGCPVPCLWIGRSFCLIIQPFDEINSLTWGGESITPLISFHRYIHVFVSPRLSDNILLDMPSVDSYYLLGVIKAHYRFVRKLPPYTILVEHGGTFPKTAQHGIQGSVFHFGWEFCLAIIALLNILIPDSELSYSFCDDEASSFSSDDLSPIQGDYCRVENHYIAPNLMHQMVFQRMIKMNDGCVHSAFKLGKSFALIERPIQDFIISNFDDQRTSSPDPSGEILSSQSHVTPLTYQKPVTRVPELSDVEIQWHYHRIARFDRRDLLWIYANVLRSPHLETNPMNQSETNIRFYTAQVLYHSGIADKNQLSHLVSYFKSLCASRSEALQLLRILQRRRRVLWELKYNHLDSQSSEHVLSSDTDLTTLEPCRCLRCGRAITATSYRLPSTLFCTSRFDEYRGQYRLSSFLIALRTYARLHSKSLFGEPRSYYSFTFKELDSVLTVLESKRISIDHLMQAYYRTAQNKPTTKE